MDSYQLLGFLLIISTCAPFCSAVSIGVSPPNLNLNYGSEESIYLTNPNNFDIKYKIMNSDNYIEFKQETGMIKANSQKKIIVSLKENKLISKNYIFSINNGDIISPSVAIKITSILKKEETQSKVDLYTILIKITPYLAGGLLIIILTLLIIKNKNYKKILDWILE